MPVEGIEFFNLYWIWLI